MLAQAGIDLSALRHNLGVVRQHAPNSKVLAMIKANAYGHGAVEVAKALDGAESLGVARLDEGILLREAGITKPIVLMGGVLSGDELLRASQAGLDLVVHQAYQAEIIHKTKLKTPISVWLKCETGMHRLGLPAAKILPICKDLSACDWVTKPLYLLSHFACADERENPATSEQIARFFQILPEDRCNYHLSLANSAGIFAWPDSHLDWVRPGIMLYGISPFNDVLGHELNLRPVMQLESPLMAIKDLPQGAPIGYGATWRCPEPMRVGVVAMGYGDGYPRYIRPGTPVLINGKMANILGRVSMDLISIDLRGHTNYQIGDLVRFWGEGLPVEVIAKQANTTSYELVAGITSRVAYKYEGNLK